MEDQEYLDRWEFLFRIPKFKKKRGNPGKRSAGYTPSGLAALSPERRKEIASMGGKASHQLGVAHNFTKEEAVAAGRKGGIQSGKNRKQRKQDQQNS